jgi:hypothetical protein
MGAEAKARLWALRSLLDHGLFPAPAPPTQRLSRGRRIAIGAGFVLLAALLELLRPGWSASLHTLWAEDGSIFLHGALTKGFGETVLSPYANYLVVVPRLIVEAATVTPLDQAPATISILSALLIGLSGLVVWLATAGHIESPYLRATLAVVTVLVPVSGLESLDSAVYVSWYMLFASFWVLLWRPATTGGATLAGLFVLATALSNPGVWFLVPLALLRGFTARDRRDAIVVGCFALGAIAQAPVVALNHEQTYTPMWSHDIPTAYLQRVLDGAAFGQHLGGSAWAHLGWPFLALLLLTTVIVLATGLRYAGAGARLLAAVAIPTSIAMFFVSAYQRALGPELVWPGGAYNGSGGRYAIVPALLLVSVGLATVDSIARRRPDWQPARWLTPAAIALIAVSVVLSFDMGDSAVRGVPTWEEELHRAAVACPDDASVATVPIAPNSVGFAVELPCGQIVSFR